MPDYSIIQNLCKELEISISELMDGEDTDNNSVRLYDDTQIMDLLKRTQDLESQKKTLYGVLLIFMGIATLAVSKTFGGSDFKDFISGILLWLSVSFCAFFGYLLSEKTGLLKEFRFKKSKLITTVVLTVIAGVIFSLDYWTFGKIIPQIIDSYQAGLTFIGAAASIFYGWIIEEILLRFFFMSLLVFILWKVFARKKMGIISRHWYLW